MVYKYIENKHNQKKKKKTRYLNVSQTAVKSTTGRARRTQLVTGQRKKKESKPRSGPPQTLVEHLQDPSCILLLLRE